MSKVDKLIEKIMQLEEFKECDFINIQIAKGYVKGDVTIDTASNGKKYSRVSIGVDRDGKTKDGNKSTDYIVNQFWSDRAEKLVSTKVKSGDFFCVIGSVQNNKGKTRCPKCKQFVSCCGEDIRVTHSVNHEKKFMVFKREAVND
ncbi:MAG: single-stranded DNA-binding protein [Firmicutes bacterium]|nr:single-stranded DNA-binding protein [Bacillota bacterium]